MNLYGVRDALLEAKRVIAFTGAGISVPSGIPDFRSRNGIWAEYPPEEFGTLEAFLLDPPRWWGFYRALSRVFGQVAPNPAHQVLAELESMGLLETVITQNVDRLHQRAGNGHVIELHGTDRRLKCVACQTTIEAEAPLEGGLPECARCGQILKPDVVLFGEALTPGVIEEAQELACRGSRSLRIASRAAADSPGV